MSQIPVLHALMKGSSLSQKDLAHLAGVEQPTMAEMLARLERDGVVQRKPNPKDRRGSLVSLTRRSRLRLPEARIELIQVEKEAMAGLSTADKETLRSLLQRVINNIDGELPKCEG